MAMRFDAKKISKRIQIAYYKITGKWQGADDCSQEIILKMLEGKHKHSTINQCVIDYLRSINGHKESKNYDIRKSLANPIPYNEGFKKKIGY